MLTLIHWEIYVAAKQSTAARTRHQQIFPFDSKLHALDLFGWKVLYFGCLVDSIDSLSSQHPLTINHKNYWHKHCVLCVCNVQCIYCLFRIFGFLFTLNIHTSIQFWNMFTLKCWNRAKCENEGEKIKLNFFFWKGKQNNNKGKNKNEDEIFHNNNNNIICSTVQYESDWNVSWFMLSVEWMILLFLSLIFHTQSLREPGTV